MKRRILCSVLLLSICALLGCNVRNPASQGDEKKSRYQIKLARPDKVGDKYHLHAHGTRSTQETAAMQGKRFGKTNLLSVELDGNIEVLDVDAKGQQQKLSLTILKCNVATNGIPRALFTNGTVIIVQESNGEDVFQINGKAVAKPAAETLGIVIDVNGPENDDAAFGTTASKAIGETWPLNTQAALSTIKGSGSLFEPKDLAGQGRLAAVTTVDGEPCLEITASMNSTNFTLPSKQNVNVHEAKFDISFEGFFPTNTSRRLLKESTSARVILRADLQGPKGNLSRDLLFEETTEREFGS